LTVWRAHIDGSHVNSIVSAGQWDLKLQIISIILSRVGCLWD
jgi:hypothetical protein